MLEGQEQMVENAPGEGRSRSMQKPELPVWLLAALLGLATLVVYCPILRNGFIEFDDPGYVTANARVQAGLSWNNVAWAFSSFEMGNWHPLAWMSHMLDCQLFGVHPAGHHATSIVLHALNAVLLFLLLQKATGFRWRSLLVAGLFAFHPLNVETVAWVAERKSLLSMLFSLATIGLYGWYARAPDWWRYLAVMAGLALALLSKPMAVTLPVILLLLDYWPLGRLGPGANGAGAGRQALKLVLEKTPLFLMSLASSWITVVAQKRGEAVSSIASLPISARLENTAVAYATYLRRMVWPNDLSYFYPHPGSHLPLWKVSAAVVVLLSISMLVYRFRQRRYLVFGWVLFLVTLLPVIGIVQVGSQSMADRYAYIPLIGLFIAAVWELAELSGRLGVPVAGQAGAALVLLAAAATCTAATERYWHDNVTLFSRAHDVTPTPDLEIETNLAAALNDEGRTSEALVHFRNVESMAPNTFTAHYNVGYLLAGAGDNPGAVKEFQDALRFARQPANRARALNSLGIAYLNLGESPQAIQTFTELIAIQPDNAASLARRGQAYYEARQYTEASRDFLRATQLDPAPELLMMEGKSLEGAGEAREAIAVYRQVLNADPNQAEARERIESLEKRQPAH
jgi:Flp pilus assembly protein TadD